MRFMTFAAATLAAVIGGTAARAELVEAVFTGTIYNSSDATGVFGLGSGSNVLDDQEFTLTYVYDTSAGAEMTDTGLDVIYGGDMWGPSPVVSASLTINGVTLTFDGDTESFVGVCNADYCNGSDLRDYEAYQYTNDGTTYLESYTYTYFVLPAFTMPFDLTEPLSYTSDEMVEAGGDFFFYGCTPTQTDCTTTTDVSGEYTIASVSIRSLAPVPLPAGAGLLGASLALMGLVARRRARARAAA